jgi:lipopolysaccharide export system ATP-binding protein
MPILECFGLVKDYPGKRAVDGIDFYVERGEIVGLLGPNGAGKTTIFRMACGLISATEGRVLLAGDDVTRWPMYKRARHGMGFLPQDDSIFRKLTVEQNLRAILEYLKLSRTERESRITTLLGQFGLEDKRKQIAGTLSGGERRRLEIARCLSSKPSLILLDEPFTGIDPVTIHSIQDIIADLCSSGIAVLLTDHRERETLTVTDRSYIVCAGKVVVSGDAETVLNDPTAMEHYFGRRFDAASIIEGKQSFGTNPRPKAKDETKSDESSHPDESVSESETNEKQADINDDTADDDTRDQAA